MAGATALLVGGTRQQGVGKLVRARVRCVHAALGLAQDPPRHGGITVLVQHPLRGRGVGGVAQGLVDRLAEAAGVCVQENGES
ncbi:MAG TPA: hypothetical protein VLQ80_30320 [Candidatus Saccharimonadia bacterium]|nr:hypothetical protein [Candidatus Saccharimonadia bacterium]